MVEIQRQEYVINLHVNMVEIQKLENVIKFLVSMAEIQSQENVEEVQRKKEKKKILKNHML